MQTQPLRPRWAVQLKVPASDTKNPEMLDLPVHAYSGTWTQNDHSQADTLNLTVDWDRIGIDPRIVRNANVEFYCGLADEFGRWEPTSRGGRSGRGNCRFVGTITEPERLSSEGNGYTLSFNALDYTDFFLRAKPFGTAGIPDYSQTLDDAFRRIVSQVPGAEKLAAQLVKFGFDAWPKIGDVVSERLRGKNQIPTHPRTDAWAVWKQVVGMCGLITFVDLDRIVVTTPEAYYRKTDPVVFTWGKNAYEIKEQHRSAYGNGIGLTAYDSLGGRLIEAVWPPRQDKRVKRGKAKARQIGDSPDEAIVEQYDWFPFPGVSNPTALLAVAKAIYAERSKQEYQGDVTTYDLLGMTRDKVPYDLLDLEVGDNIIVQANANKLDVLLRFSRRAREVYLVERGYNPSAAAIIAATADRIPYLESTFYLKGTKLAFDSSGPEGSVELGITYCNRLLYDGSAPDDEVRA